jgi:hypothetical protein
MFEKQRESLEASKNYQKAKLHVQTHKMAYACLGSAAVSGSLVTLLKSRPLEVTNITNVAPSIAPVFNNSNQQVNFGGHMTKLVKCLETGKVWEKVTEAANDNGVSLAKMSKHLNGHKGHVNDLHYQIIGMGTA